jgi:serine protease
VQKRVIQAATLTTFFLVLAAFSPLSVFAATTAQKESVSASAINPYSPAYQHSYRHGTVPTIAQLNKMKYYQQANPGSSAASNTLSYGGGIDGIGVTSGKEKVYLVFWGTQWGTQSTNSSGDLTFSNDSAGGAPHVQDLFKGVGTGNELWSGTMTQFCDGSSVSVGATSCSSSAAHVGYPTGGALAGTWYDNSGAEPDPASGNQLANEAINAAAHFGNTTPASNRYSQYVILSATGTDPDNYQSGGFCAWHDYNGDTTLSGDGAATSPYGDIAFTNLPYLLDAGTSCGQNYVNSGSAGTLDGYTIGAGNVRMGNGSYAMQSTWSNDTNACDLSHAIIGDGTGTNDFSISSNPASMSIVRGGSGTATINTAVVSGSAASISLVATVSPSGPIVSLSATTVTAGNSATLTISVGSSVAIGTYTITVKGTEGSATHSTTVSVSVISASGGVTNGGFETASFSGWTVAGTTSISSTAHSGTHSGQAGGTSPTSGDSSISQTFTAPAGTKTLSFWYRVQCPDTLTYDWATATLKDNTSGATTTPLAKTCNTNGTWVKVSASITAGHSYTLKLVSHDDNYPGDPTYTLYDDVTVS